MVVLPGLGQVTALSSLVGLSIFLFSAILDTFLIWGLVLGRGGLNWLVWDWGLGPSCPPAPDRFSSSL